MYIELYIAKDCSNNLIQILDQIRFNQCYVQSRIYQKAILENVKKDLYSETHLQPCRKSYFYQKMDWKKKDKFFI